MYNMTILLQIFKIAFEQRGKNHVSQNLTRILTNFFLILFFFCKKSFFHAFSQIAMRRKYLKILRKIQANSQTLITLVVTQYVKYEIPEG